MQFRSFLSRRSVSITYAATAAGSASNVLASIQEGSAPLAFPAHSAAAAAVPQAASQTGSPASHRIPKSSSMLSLEGTGQQFTDLHEALAEGVPAGHFPFGQPGNSISRSGYPHTAVWAPPSLSSHSRDSSMDSPMWPPSSAGAAGPQPLNNPALGGSAFGGAAAFRLGTSPLQPTWAPQTVPQQNGYSGAAAHDSSAALASWAPQQLPTPFGSTASAPKTAGGYWNAPKPQQPGQGHAHQPYASQPTPFAAAAGNSSAAEVGGVGQHSPDGRPPCAILSFGFGGRAVLVRSQAIAAEASAYGFGGEGSAL